MKINLLLAPVLFFQCATVATSAAPPEKKAVIGVSLLTMTNPFFRDLGEAMKDEAAKHHMEVILTAGEMDPAKQANQVSDFVTRRVSAIVLSPCDSKSVGPVIAEANKAGIPVFTVDIAALASGAKVVSHVATDNLSGGKMAATAMIEALGGKGTAAVLGAPELESALLRVKGFEEELARYSKEHPPGIQVIAKLAGNGAKDKSFQAAEDLLQAHPNVNGIFAVNDPSALGAVAALEKTGKLAQVKVIGFDGMPEGKQAIKAGTIYADPMQYPEQLGRKSVDGIVKYLAGEDVPPTVLIPTGLYRKADADADKTLK